MATSDQAILDAARERLLKILNAGVEEFGEQGESARMLQIDKLEETIRKYEARVAGACRPIFQPIVPVQM